MPVKNKYYPGYWSTKTPIPASKVLRRRQEIRDGAGVKGGEIATLDAGRKLLVDLAERALGWTRIINVEGVLPEFIINQEGKPEQEREGWVDDTALGDDQPAPSTGRRWTYKITVEEIKE